MSFNVFHRDMTDEQMEEKDFINRISFYLLTKNENNNNKNTRIYYGCVKSIVRFLIENKNKQFLEKVYLQYENDFFNIVNQMYEYVLDPETSNGFRYNAIENWFDKLVEKDKIESSLIKEDKIKKKKTNKI